ncbi:TfoX/Sxy family protein [Microlunatus speluncae]|uniref:TfoX/Sxy family protein n=1 Tax=Microlunatus speluncae TaxID=2594267 RepID=UPI00126672CD|nr:TfoX/Sxy family protein [Microlunatus speluncae]
MPYDAELAERVRSALSGRDAVREIKMFGGLAFMLEERMVVCVSAGGAALLVRVSPDRDAELLTEPGAQRAEMGQGRSMGEGWITVDQDVVDSDDELRHWIDAALAFHAEGSGRNPGTKRKQATKKPA